VGKTVGVEVEDLISGNISGAAKGMDVQSLSAGGSYDEVFEGVDSHDCDDIPAEEDKDQFFLDNEEVQIEDDVSNMPDEDGYNDPNHLLVKIENYHEEQYKRDQIPLDMEAGIVLLCELRKNNVSLEVYNKITKWVEQFYSYTGPVGKPPGCNAMIKYLTH